MKQLLLILAFLLPLCAYPQLKEPFNGPEITSDNPWTDGWSHVRILPGKVFP